MILIPETATILLHGPFVDLRNGFDGLTFIALSAFKKHMTDEVYVVFINRRRTRIKVLHYTPDRASLWYIRSNKGCFFPLVSVRSGSISCLEFEMILRGKSPDYLFFSDRN